MFFLPVCLYYVLFTVLAFAMNKTVILTEAAVLLCLYYFSRQKKFPVWFLSIITCTNVIIIAGFRTTYDKAEYDKILRQKNVAPVVLSSGEIKGKKQENFFRRSFRGPMVPCQIQGMVTDRDEKFLYVCCLFGGIRDSLFKIDLQKNVMSERGAGKGLSAVALLNDEKKLFVTSFIEKSLFVYLTDPLTVAAEIRLKNANPLDLSKLTGKDEFIVLDERQKMYKLCFVKGSPVLKTLSLPGIGIPQYFDVNEKKGAAYLANTSSQRPVIAVDIHSFKISRTKEKSFFPLWFLTGIAVDDEKQKIYVADMLRGKVSVLDERTFSVEREITLHRGLRCMAYDRKRHLVYAGNYFSGEVVAISTTNYSIAQTFYVGRRIRKFYITPRSGRVFVSSGFGLFELKL